MGLAFWLEAGVGAAETAPPAAPPEEGLQLRVLRPLNLDARAFLVAYLPPTGEPEILVERNAREPLPLASLTKLMTALVVRENYDVAKLVTIAPADLVEPFDPSFFRVGETFTVASLLNSLLVESSNWSAAALARVMGRDNFILTMNETAARLDLETTTFFNPSGLDQMAGAVNHASAYDLLQLATAINETAPEILTATTQENVPLLTAQGQFHHRLIPTNKLLGQERWPVKIVGGKTGQTDLARKNLLLVLEDQASGGQLVTIVLGADDHFTTTATLLDWLYTSYDFS